MAVEAKRLDYGLFIDNRWQEPANGQAMVSLRPADGQVLATVPVGSEQDVDKAVQAARRALPVWSGMTGPARARILSKAADILESRADEYAQLLVSEAGSWIGKAKFEVGFAINLLRSAAEDHKLIAGETFGSEDPTKLSLTLRQPLGVIGVITPWNFPLLLSTKKVAHALIAGNTAVLKPAEETPVLGLKLGELLAEAGLPDGVLNVVTGDGPTTGSALVHHPDVRLITFTGSTATGRIIAANCGRQLKRVILELGGKDPVIVLKDADMDYAVNAVAFAAFMHQGQICMSVERVIVEEPIAEEFARRLADKARTIKVGEVLGPIIHKNQLDIIDSHVRDAVEKGAKLLAGGERRDPYYPATVLSGVGPDMKIYRDETFGPVAPIISVRDVDEALAVANDSEYGLSSGVITNDLQAAIYVAERLQTGMVHINDACVHDECNAPFGGVKGSGIGREGGRLSMEALTEVKWVTIQKGQRKFPF